ncbi:MAG TPA: hypothetical protein VLC93_00085 [Myxococcota bacterium]|nr:hypothetical protein [Myxococcota bacterium]
MAALVSHAAAAQAGELHMADVQALAKANAWVELLARATDVPPSERNATWNELVTKAAVARANDTSLTDRNVTDENEALLQVYPMLAANREFMDARGRRGVVAFGGCFRDAYELEVCLTRARAFVNADPKNATLAKEMGLLVARHAAPKAPAVEFFHKAVSAARVDGDAGAKSLKEICAKPELADAATSALTNFDADNVFVVKAREITDWCWAHVDHDKFVKAALDGDRGFANACGTLLAKKAVTGTREKKCKNVVSKP